MSNINWFYATLAVLALCAAAIFLPSILGSAVTGG